MAEQPASIAEASERIPVWTEQFSKKFQLPYWFDSSTGISVWEKPEGFVRSIEAATALDAKHDSPSGRATKRLKTDRSTDEHAGEENGTMKSSVKDSSRSSGDIECDVKIAIIVPFRDLHVEQKRSDHLRRFVPEMSEFLKDQSFVIYIIEQSNDGLEFNRGMLLNIGFKIAKSEGCNTFIFHDVDLMPSPELLPYYRSIPSGLAPIHIAKRWNRYNRNNEYFGGIVAFSAAQFQSINGYPNNFWGWGGEDDELKKRANEVCVNFCIFAICIDISDDSVATVTLYTDFSYSGDNNRL